jgi:hypothetical protein
MAPAAPGVAGTLPRAPSAVASLAAAGRDRVLVSLFAVGLLIRLLLVSSKGTTDMDSYIAWGRDVVDHNLAFAYHGIYFPLQYEIFAYTVRLSALLDLSEITTVKLINLACDIVAFLVLTVLLNRFRLPSRYALIYWITPYFLAIYWLGYVDAQIGLLVLLSVLVLTYRSSPFGFAVAGVPFGAAVLMKPQVMTLVLVLVLGAGLAWVAARRLRAGDGVVSLRWGVPCMLVFAAALLVAFSLYIGATGRDYGKGYRYVERTYTPADLERWSPGLTGDMLNIWYPVAYANKQDATQPIALVSEPRRANDVGTAVTLLLVAAGVTLVVARSQRLSAAGAVLALFAVGTLIAPMTITHAHENHLFLGALLAVPLLAVLRDRWLFVAYQAMFAVQFLHLVGRYGLGYNSLSTHLTWLTGRYGDRVALVAALVMIALYLVFAIRLVRAIAAGKLALPAVPLSCRR